MSRSLAPRSASLTVRIDAYAPAQRVPSIVVLWPVMSPAPLLASQAADAVPPLHRPLDQLLDLNVRDGLVYYRALRSERGRLDRYVASLNVAAATYQGWSRDEKIAFWLNAYNAIVLQTVINALSDPAASAGPVSRRRASGRSPARSSRPSIASPAAR